MSLSFRPSGIHGLNGKPDVVLKEKNQDFNIGKSIYKELKKQHQDYPIDKDVIWRFVQEIQSFVDAVWYDPDEALHRGSFV